MTEQEKFPIEASASYPAPGMAVPNKFIFSQDDTRLLYLFRTDSTNSAQVLHALDVKSGEQSVAAYPPGGGVQEDRLSPEEELRRQRERMLAVGLTHISRAGRSDRVLVPVSGAIYVIDNSGDPLRLVFDNGDDAPALTPRLSADGAWVAYVQAEELYIIPAAGGQPRQITHDARGTGKTNGLADYIAQEELSRGDGFWWSPDAAHIAYTHVDETHIPVYCIVHQGKDFTGDSAQEDHHYPFAGAENPRVALRVIPRDGGEPVTMDTDFGDEVYLLHVFWWSADVLGASFLNREQDQYWLVRFDITTGARELVRHERSDYWINLRGEHLQMLKDGRYITLSEQDGYKHLYLYEGDTCVSQLTSGEWMVDELAGVNENTQTVYFTGTRKQPTEKHLYAVHFDGGDPQQITQRAGYHEVVLDNGCTHFVDVHSALATPFNVTLRALEDGHSVHTIYENDDPRVAAFGLEPPEIVSLQNRHGDTLYGAIYRPPARFGSGAHPVVVHVYGGPGPQMIADHWKMTASLQLQYLRNRGFLVFRLDNRGSARRGLAFEGALKHRMGTVEVDDQVDGVRWLVAQGIADPDRVGIFGWSYGGYMALMGLAKAPAVFKVAVAGAPVTHWDGYDTCYTERYMSTPQANPEGYAEGSVMTHVENIAGKLLLIHGMIDENVHFRHTARLINALIVARQPYDILLFPDERHMPRRPADRVYLNENIVGYFQKHLSATPD
jgi:dipeptidyl-peptidase 4